MPEPVWVFKSDDWPWWDEFSPGLVENRAYVRTSASKYRRLHGRPTNWRDRMWAGQMAYWLDTNLNLVYAMQAISHRSDVGEGDPHDSLTAYERVYGTIIPIVPVQVRHPGQSWTSLHVPSLSASAHMLVVALEGDEADTFASIVAIGGIDAYVPERERIA